MNEATTIFVAADGWLASRFLKKHTPVTPMRKAFVENRPALVGKNAYGEYVAQFDDPPQDHGWHVVTGPVDFVDEVLDGETTCESSSAVVALTEIVEK